MILRWKGSFDEFLARAPFESQVEDYSGNPAFLPAVTMSLEAILGELWVASREYQLHHTLLVKRHDDARMDRDGPERPDDPRLRPVAFSTWGAPFAGRLPDGTLELLGGFELLRGRSDGYERFASLVLQVMRALLDGARGIPDFDLVAMWMLDLYASARNGLPGLSAEARVRHGKRGWRRLRREELIQPSTSTEAARLPADAQFSPSWYAQMEPECFAASALKVKAILLGLGRAAQKCQAHEDWRPTAWLHAIIPSLNTETLRKARERGAESDVSQLRYQQRGRLYFYEVRSVCLKWPEYAERILAALSIESAVA
ncbi:MAG: hypothetical protein HND58_04285 [Planctomycetota bacterium]|nr:MAG: hypothetical protein HND58_04285 [Planctomycetota bacterium]